MNKQMGFVIDQERCIGCEACTVACRIEHNVKQGFIKVITQNVDQKDTPEGIFPDLKMNFLPQLCNHCANPPCVDVCNVEALRKREDGIVVIDNNLCDGCQACLSACPYDAINFNQEKNIAEKCNLCAHRIDQGLEPFCVICCEGQAIYLGDFNDPRSEVSKLNTKRDLFKLKTDAGTNPSTSYSPPMSKRSL